MEKELKEQIKKALNYKTQDTLFNVGQDNPTLEEACIAFLKYKGYKVRSPVKFKYKINNLDDLINFFYVMLDSKHPEYVSTYRNVAKDRKIASLFLKNRIETTGNSKEIALKECAAIIASVFNHEKEFKFRTKIFFGMFGQKNLSWITEKAVSIINREADIKRDADRKRELERIEEEQMSNYKLGFSEDEIDALLAGIEKEKS